MDNPFSKNDINVNNTQEEKGNTKEGDSNNEFSSSKGQNEEQKISKLNEKNKDENKNEINNSLDKTSIQNDQIKAQNKDLILEKDSIKSEKKKKEGIGRKMVKKNIYGPISPRKKREIKPVGKVSAKLSALIQRLGQSNPLNETTTTNQYGEKVVMGPKIKAALEKFNKTKQNKNPRFQHSGHSDRRNKSLNKNNEEKDDKEDAISNGYNEE